MQQRVSTQEMVKRPPIDKHPAVGSFKKEIRKQMMSGIDEGVVESGEQRTIKEESGDGHDTAELFSSGLERQKRSH